MSVEVKPLWDGRFAVFMDGKQVSEPCTQQEAEEKKLVLEFTITDVSVVMGE